MINNKVYYLLFALASLVYAIGFNITVMDVDSAQYASISQQMNDTGEYLQVKHNGEDYLDKPPLLFWVTSFFFNLFGYQNWVFKIGSFLFTLLGVYSTFRLGKILYNKDIGQLAALILYSCQAYFLFNNDVRTDTILSGTVIFAIWQFVEWYRSKSWKWLFGAALGIGLAMLAKGPIGLVIPAMAISGYFVGLKSWKSFLRWEYFVLLAAVALVLTPMLYGLYEQFDKHPEKITSMVSPDGKQDVEGVSGVKFYLWTQSFGRISGENVWKDGSGPFFFIHNFLWSFMPWSLLFIFAFYSKIRELWSQFRSKKEFGEMLTIIGFLLPFIALSKSSYKLPHYIFPLYPLASILVAWWWMEYIPKLKSFKLWRNAALSSQLLVALVSIGVLGLIYFQFFTAASWLDLIVILSILVVAMFYLFKYQKKGRVYFLFATVLFSIAVNFSMNSWFYPKLMQFQGGSNMVDAIAEEGIDPEEVYNYSYYSFSYDYYLPNRIHPIRTHEIDSILESKEYCYVVTSEDKAKGLTDDFQTEKVISINEHAVTRLNFKFLSENTRIQTLKKLYLLRIERKE